jgi:hypothetical protein
MTKPTKSFFILSTCAALLSVTALVARQLQIPDLEPLRSDASGLNTAFNDEQTTKAILVPYAHEGYGIRFSHPSNWGVATGDENGFFFINLYPNEASIPITIHIGSEYYGFTSLDTEPIEWNGYGGVRVDESLFGFIKGDTKYTFDLQNNTNYEAAFQDVLNSLELY